MSHLRLAKQVFLRLLSACAIFVGAVVSFLGLLLPALQSAFGLSDAATSVVRRCGMLLVIVLAYWGYVRLVEKREVHELRPAPMAIAIGAGTGALLIALPMLLIAALGAYDVTAWRGLQSGLFGVAGLILIAAMLEEVVFRGFLFRILEDALGSVPALWLQSLAFAALHVENIDAVARPQDFVTTLVSVTLLGALWNLIFIHSRNLWVSGFNHAAWNFTIILSGVSLSGLDDWRALAPLVNEPRGPAWLTGGSFGPENSVITIAAVIASLVVLMRWARAKQRLVERGSNRLDVAARQPAGDRVA